LDEFRRDTDRSGAVIIRNRIDYIFIRAETSDDFLERPQDGEFFDLNDASPSESLFSEYRR
jgi:hypothetical protein